MRWLAVGEEKQMLLREYIGREGGRRAVLDSGRRRGGKWKGIGGVQCRAAGGQLVGVEGDPKAANLSACLSVSPSLPWRAIDMAVAVQTQSPVMIISLLPTDRILQFRAHFTDANPLQPPWLFAVPECNSLLTDSLRVMDVLGGVKFR